VTAPALAGCDLDAVRAAYAPARSWPDCDVDRLRLLALDDLGPLAVAEVTPEEWADYARITRKVVRDRLSAGEYEGDPACALGVSE